MKEATIHILHASLIKDNLSFLLSFVDENRKEKALKYAKEKDQLLSLGAGYLMKKYLPKGEIKTTESGKPYLEDGPYFNISHSGEYVVLAINSEADVGVDVEKIDENRRESVKFVSNKEEKEIEDINSLFQIWSNKESLIKCMGTSIGDIKNINGLPLEGMRVINGENYYTKSMIYNGYSLSVTLKDKEPFAIVKFLNDKLWL